VDSAQAGLLAQAIRFFLPEVLFAVITPFLKDRLKEQLFR